MGGGRPPTTGLLETYQPEPRKRAKAGEQTPGSRARQLHKLGKLSQTNGETLEQEALELEEVTGHAEQQRGVSKGAGWGTLTPWLWIEVGSHSNGQQQAKRLAPSKGSGLACSSFLQR